MNLHFTEHALARLAKRGLQRQWVERVVDQPAKIEPDPMDPALEHRYGPVPELANRVLRVIVSKQAPHRIITAHLDRNMKGKL
jgi:hypothetical protein